jgi:spermidine/putrescine transport system permease protein
MPRGLRNWALGAWSVAALVYLFIPIAIVILFSFNDPQGRFNITWEGFTLDHWRSPFAVEGLQDAMVNSLSIAAIATALAVVMGTFMGLALVRYRFRGHGPLDFFVFLPLATPEVVLGAALLGLFITAGVATGFWTIVIAHTMFNVAYVVVTIRARLQGMDLHIEEAAMDLGANEWTTFRKVTLPLIAPGVAAAALLGFALSVDDFVITNFTAGQTVTFPVFIWGAARQGVPPQVNVLATMLLLAVLALMVLNVVVQRRRARADAAAAQPARAAVQPGLAQ